MTKAEIKSELNGVIEAIGKSRATGGDDLEALRAKRVELETELSELSAENAYFLKQDQEAAASAHREAVQKTLDEYDTAEGKYFGGVKKINSTLQRLHTLESVLSAQVESLIDSGNPLQILQPVWKELSPEQQAGLKTRFEETYPPGPPVQSNIPKILDSLSLHQSLMTSTSGRLMPEPEKSTRRFVGGGVRTSKLPDTEIPFEKRLDKPFETPSRCTVKRLIPGTGRPKRTPMAVA